MRDEYETALDGAARLRDDYHREIIKLHRSGVSLREIAEVLGISHQRVHQIVSPPDQATAPRRKATSAIVASALILSVLAAGVVFLVQDQAPEPPKAQIRPSAVPIGQGKEAACARFSDLFRNQPRIIRNVDCADVVSFSLRGAVAIVNPRNGEVLAVYSA